jgi:3-dehydroquinate synthase
MTRSVHIKASSGEYPVAIGRGGLARLAERITVLSPSRVFVITDDNVEAAQGKRIRALLPEAHVIVEPAGEKTKSMVALESIYTALLAGGVDRDSLVVAFGGGVVGDLAGFAAATILRGIRCVQAPTSLLAMVDSSVGGKTGINHARGKNLIGAFHQPVGVYCDLDMLETLPRREYVSALAEVVKTALLAPGPLLEGLLRNPAPLREQAPEETGEVIETCVAFKAQVVAEDERETTGRRAVLNLGHTLGHVLEAAFPGRYLHGEAVSVGLAAALKLSVRRCGFDEGLARDVTQLLEGFGLPTQPPPGLEPDKALQFLLTDKKRTAGNLRMILLAAPSQPELVEFTPNEEFAQELLA